MSDYKDQLTTEDTNAQGDSGSQQAASGENNDGKNYGASGAAQTGTQKSYKSAGVATASSNASTETSGGVGGTAVEKAKETASTLLDQAKTTASGAYDAVADKANSVVEEQKLELMVGLSGVADTVRRVSGALSDGESQLGATEYAARHTETAAQKLDDLAQYLEKTDIKGLARDVESYAKRNPAIFLGGAFVLGVLAARFFKSTPMEITEGSENGGSQSASTRASKTQGGSSASVSV